MGASYWNCMPVRDLPGGAPGIQSTESGFSEGKTPWGRVRLSHFLDEADAARLGERRGEVLTAAELRLVVRISDPEAAAEVLHFKRTLDGRISGHTAPGPLW